MLDLIRNNVQSTGVKFIVGLIILVMVFFGVNAFRNQNINSIATIDGYEIKAEQYQRAYDQTQNEMRQRFQGQAAEYMKMMNVPAQIVQRLINTVLMMKSAEKNGLSVTDMEVAHTIYENPAFQTDGRFDEKKYDRLLANYRTDKLSYEKDLRESLLAQKYTQFISSSMLVNRKEVESEIKKYTTEMEVKVVEITPSLFMDSVTVSDEEIASYYDSHHPDFQQKKQFVLKYITLDLQNEMAGLKVREREVTRYYEKNKATEFTTKDSFKTRHILVSFAGDNADEKKLAKEKIERIYQQLQSKKSLFEELAKNNSMDPGSAANGGNLGWVEKGTFVPEFEAVVGKLKVDEISEPFLTQFGYHVVQLQERKTAATASLEEVREQIETSIKDRKAKRRLQNKIAKMVQSMEEQTFEAVASVDGHEIVTSEAFDDGKTLDGIGYTYQLYQEVREKNLNDKGSFDLPDGERVVVYQVDKIVDPFVKPLEEVKEDAAYFARNEKAEATTIEKLAEYQSTIHDAKGFMEIAKIFNLTPQEGKLTAVDRNNDLMLSDKARAELFRLEKGQVTAVIQNKDGVLVWLVDKEETVDIAQDEDLYQRVETAMMNLKANSILSGLINQTRSEVEIKVNQPMMDALNIKLN